MNPFGLPENKHNCVDCYDEKNKKVVVPSGFTITTLSITQLKKLGIPTVKGFAGFRKWRIGRRGSAQFSPILVNLIRIEDVEKALIHVHELDVKKHLRTHYNINDFDKFFKK